ncbi:hypothetical protein [Rudaea sp.]|uniref:hypothetical protein n=1 Tax=Rudaea sp. TaxID=2136325 RepID=UPI003783D488
MSTLRLRIELNKGRIGMPLHKLAQVCQETTRFLDMLCEDIGLSAPKSGWLAEEFENASVDFDVRHPDIISEQLAALGRRALRMVLSDDYDDPALGFAIRIETRRQYKRIGGALDPDEVARFGIYKNGEQSPEQWFELHRTEVIDTASGLIDRNAYGEIQGTVNAFFKEHSPPYLRVRELATGVLVNCYFRPEMYQTAVELLEDRDAVVFVEGWIKEDAATGHTREIRVQDFRPAPEFDPNLYRRMLGALPDYTGASSSEDFVRSWRDDG